MNTTQRVYIVQSEAEEPYSQECGLFRKLERVYAEGDLRMAFTVHRARFGSIEKYLRDNKVREVKLERAEDFLRVFGETVGPVAGSYLFLAGDSDDSRILENYARELSTWYSVVELSKVF